MQPFENVFQFQPLYDSSNCKKHGKQDIGHHFEKAYSEKNKKRFFFGLQPVVLQETFLYSSEKRQPSADFSAQYSECKEADFLGNTKPTATIKN